MSSIVSLRIISVLFLAIVVLIIFSLPAFCGTTGIISGTISDASSGAMISRAQVQIDGIDTQLISNDDGYYVITNVAPGDYKVSVSADGYAPSAKNQISVLMDITTTVDFQLSLSVAAEQDIVVTEAKPVIQRDLVPTMYVVDAKREAMTRSNPNTMYQIPGLVATQPGIITDADGWPHIRGGRANQVGYLIDGIPVTEPVTNSFGTNTVTVGMDKMEIFTGGYRPEYGNAISGVFNQVIKTGKNADGNYLRMLGGSDSYKGIFPEVGGEFTNGGDYFISGYSWHSDLSGTSYNEVDSNDMVGKFTYPVGNNNTLSLLSLRGSAKYQFPSIHTQTLDTDITDDTVTIPVDEERDHNHQSYILNALAYTHTFSPTAFVTVRPYIFQNKWNFDALSEMETGIGFWVKGKSNTKGLKLDYTNQLNQKHLIKAGAIRMASNNTLRSAFPEMYAYDYTADTDTVQSGLYIQDQIRLNPKWGFEAGLRYDKMNYDLDNADDLKESQVSPRFGLSYSVSPKTNMRFSYGRMIQFVHTQSIYREFLNPFWQEMYPNADRLKPERSSQYDLGFEHQVNSDYSMQVTPFYRKFSDLLQTTSLNPEDPTSPPYIYENLGEGTSRGLELLVRKRPSKNWSGWMSYTYSIAKASSSGTGLISDKSDYVDWDQRHTAALVLNYMMNGWTYSMMGEYGSGLPYTLAEQDRNSSRIASHTLFNVNISREINGGLLSQGEIHLGISNIFNSGAVLLRDESGEAVNRVMPRFINFTYTRRL
ncbi:MAG: TonB-dependent receptor [Armatimonadota bacterium]